MRNWRCGEGINHTAVARINFPNAAGMDRPHHIALEEVAVDIECIRVRFPEELQYVIFVYPYIYKDLT
jgi:hypothetical protein